MLPPFEQPRAAPPAAVPVIGVANAGDFRPTPVQTAPAPAPRPAASVAAKAAPVTTLPPRGGRTHVVQPKETTFGIAKRYGLRTEELYDANRDAMRTVTDLRPGMTLRIPGGAAPTGARR
jgi:LysM repeat protein